jgi:hypothetical protein
MDAAQRQATIRSRWRAAIYLGLLSSTFSTIISQLTAGRLGRDAAVDWMSVAAIPARDWALSAEPSLIAIVIGIAFHQTADFSGRWCFLACVADGRTICSHERSRSWRSPGPS